MLNPSFEACNNAHSSMGAYFPKPSSILGNIKNKPAASTIAKSPTLLTWLVKKENGTSVFKTAFLWLLQMLDLKKKNKKNLAIYLYVCEIDLPIFVTVHFLQNTYLESFLSAVYIVRILRIYDTNTSHLYSICLFIVFVCGFTGFFFFNKPLIFE